MNKRTLSIFVLIIIFAVNEVSALGITPGSFNFDFEPGAAKSIKFSVINSEKKDANFVVLTQGELKDNIYSVSLPEGIFKMTSADGEKNLEYVLKMPASLSPGPHKSEIVVMQLPGQWKGEGETSVEATVGVAAQVNVFVPYPGKYLEASLNAADSEEGGIVFVIPVVSRGKLDIVRVKAIIDIYNLNEKVDTIESEEISILSGERKEIVVKWKSDFLPGTYKAAATILYDEETLKLEKEFNIGDKILDLVDVKVNDFSLGGIAKFELLIESKWSELIKDAYLQMLVYNKEGEVMADFKSATYDVKSLEKTLMVAFWDTDGVREGVYDSSVILNYDRKSAQKDFKLDVSENEIKVIGLGYVISEAGGKKTNSLVVILVVVIAILVLINLSWFLFLRRKLHGNKKVVK